MSVRFDDFNCEIPLVSTGESGRPIPKRRRRGGGVHGRSP